MKNKLIPAIILLASTLVMSNVAANDTEWKRFSIPGNGGLLLSVPSEWVSHIIQPNDGLPPTIGMRPKRGDDIYIKITVGWNLTNIPKYNTPEQIHEIVSRAGTRIITGAVEEKLVLKKIIKGDNNGYYYSITDKYPKPDEYKYMSQGIIRVDKLQLIFTILSHEKNSDSFKKVISMLSNARQE